MNQSIGLFVCDFRCCNKNTPLPHMYRIRFHQPYMPINTGTGIPTGTKLFGIQPDSHHILFIIQKIRSQIDPKRAVSESPFTHFIPIKPHFGIRHRTIEIQIKPFLFILRGYFKIFTVPTNPLPRQFSGIPIQVNTERPLDPPIMRNIQSPPIPIVKRV